MEVRTTRKRFVVKILLVTAFNALGFGCAMAWSGVFIDLVAQLALFPFTLAPIAITETPLPWQEGVAIGIFFGASMGGFLALTFFGKSSHDRVEVVVGEHHATITGSSHRIGPLVDFMEVPAGRTCKRYAPYRD